MHYFKVLPLEMKLDILTRLPTESVLDSKLVCTNWRSVVAHPSFSKMHSIHHLNHPSSESAGKLGFLFLSESCRLHYFEYDDDQSTKPFQRIKRICFTPPFKNFRFRFVSSINGLIFLFSYSHRSVCICNPITREYLMLTKIKRNCISDGYNYEETSFGYVSSTNEYKTVRFYKLETKLEIHIYTLGSGHGWRNLGKFNFGSNLDLKLKVFFVNGALYWLDDELEMIRTFDLAVEKFCEHLAPPHLPSDGDWFYDRIGLLDGLLFCALRDRGEGGDGFDDIWLLKKNHDKEEGEEDQSLGWRKEFRIDDLNTSFLLAVTKRGGVLCLSDGSLTDSNDHIGIYDTKTSTWKSLVMFNSYILQVAPHKNTLVTLKELGVEDAKVMESAEIEEIKSREQLHEDADPDYIYLKTGYSRLMFLELGVMKACLCIMSLFKMPASIFQSKSLEGFLLRTARDEIQRKFGNMLRRGEVDCDSSMLAFSWNNNMLNIINYFAYIFLKCHPSRVLTLVYQHQLEHLPIMKKISTFSSPVP